MGKQLASRAEDPSFSNRREDRRRAILDAAEALFLDQGFEKVSLNAIIARSGGSLATAYEMFGNKQGLLREVVERRREEGLVDLSEPGWEALAPSEILLRFANRYYEFVATSRSIALMRVVIAESLSDPAFGREFYRDVNSKLIDRLSAMFRQWDTAGEAKVDDPGATAELYLAMVMCDAPIKAMLGVDPEGPNCGRIEWRLEPFLRHFEIA